MRHQCEGVVFFHVVLCVLGCKNALTREQRPARHAPRLVNWFRESSLRRVCERSIGLLVNGELISCHYSLLMNVIYSYRYKTRCCCFACSKIDLGRLEVLNEQSIVLTAVTWGIQ